MELSRKARVFFIFVFILFVQSYLTKNILPLFIAIGALAYVLFTKSSFSHALGSQEVDLERTVQKTTYFANEPIRVDLKYSYPFNDEVFVELRDRMPQYSFALEGSNVHKDAVSSLRGTSYSYDVVREKRGTAVFEGVDVIVSDKRGLYSIRKAYDVRDEITYQDSRDNIKRADYMARGSPREEVLEEDIAITKGMDFAGIREYQPGDSISDIHWKASSKMQKLLTKLSESEKYGSIYVLLDTSRSMRSSYGNRSKFNHSMLLTMQLTKVFLEHENPTGFVAFDEHTVLEKVNPAFNRSQYHMILNSLEKLPDAYSSTFTSNPSYEQEELDRESKDFLGVVLPYLSGAKRAVKTVMGTSGLYRTVLSMGDKYEKSLMLVISDLESNSKALTDTMKMVCSRGGEVLLITPYSPWYDIELRSMDVDTAESLYKNYLIKRKNMAIMRNLGVKIIEETPEESLHILYPRIREELS